MRSRKAGPPHERRAVPAPTRIASAIRCQILSCGLPPGERITESLLSRKYSVGQPTVREALFLLEREGLVTRVPNIGTFVRELDIPDVANLYQIRGALEGLAAELAAQRATAEEISQLRELGHEMERRAKTSGKTGFFQADLEFHRFLWKISGNPELPGILDPVVTPLLTFSFLRIERTLEELLQSSANHQEIVEALTSGPAAAREALERNNRLFLERYMASVLSVLMPDHGRSRLAGPALPPA